MRDESGDDFLVWKLDLKSPKLSWAICVETTHATCPATLSTGCFKNIWWAILARSSMPLLPQAVPTPDSKPVGSLCCGPLRRQPMSVMAVMPKETASLFRGFYGTSSPTLLTGSLVGLNSASARVGVWRCPLSFLNLWRRCWRTKSSAWNWI
jgi:hypothetical protein